MKVYGQYLSIDFQLLSLILVLFKILISKTAEGLDLEIITTKNYTITIPSDKKYDLDIL